MDIVNTTLDYVSGHGMKIGTGRSTDVGRPIRLKRVQRDSKKEAGDRAPALNVKGLDI